jgi:hypothetical protein
MKFAMEKTSAELEDYFYFMLDPEDYIILIASAIIAGSNCMRNECIKSYY